jgi:hypothetical protein
MAFSGKGVLIAVSLTASVVVYAVHYQQKWERAEMHKGVLRDKERIKARELQKLQDNER